MAITDERPCDVTGDRPMGRTDPSGEKLGAARGADLDAGVEKLGFAMPKIEIRKQSQEDEGQEQTSDIDLIREIHSPGLTLPSAGTEAAVF